MSHPNIERKMAELAAAFGEEEVCIQIVLYQDELRGFWYAQIEVDGEPDVEGRVGATDPAGALDALEDVL